MLPLLKKDFLLPKNFSLTHESKFLSKFLPWLAKRKDGALTNMDSITKGVWSATITNPEMIETCIRSRDFRIFCFCDRVHYKLDQVYFNDLDIIVYIYPANNYLKCAESLSPFDFGLHRWSSALEEAGAKNVATIHFADDGFIR